LSSSRHGHEVVIAEIQAETETEAKTIEVLLLLLLLLLELVVMSRGERERGGRCRCGGRCCQRVVVVLRELVEILRGNNSVVKLLLLGRQGMYWCGKRDRVPCPPPATGV
jgi:hypothetical protein